MPWSLEYALCDFALKYGEPITRKLERHAFLLKSWVITASITGRPYAPIDLDCWTVISSLITLTNKIKLGPVITYLYPQYRNIALLAKQAATFQEISNGRLEFRTGAGATPQYAVPMVASLWNRLSQRICKGINAKRRR